MLRMETTFPNLSFNSPQIILFKHFFRDWPSITTCHSALFQNILQIGFVKKFTLFLWLGTIVGILGSFALINSNFLTHLLLHLTDIFGLDVDGVPPRMVFLIETALLGIKFIYLLPSPSNPFIALFHLPLIWVCPVVDFLLLYAGINVEILHLILLSHDVHLVFFVSVQRIFRIFFWLVSFVMCGYLSFHSGQGRRIFINLRCVCWFISRF